MSSEPACRDRFGQRLRPERRPEPPQHLLPARRSLLSHSTWSGAGGTSDSHHILSYACKQSRHSNSVIRCSAIQWDENRKQWPRTLNSSSVIHVSTSLTSPPPPPVQLEHAKRVCWFCFYFKSITAEGASRASGQGWGMLNKSRGGGAGGILAALDKKSPALAPLLSHTSSPPVPAFLTQLPTVMDDDMCHIKSTCINRGSASSMLAWLNRRSELRGDMWHLRHSNPPEPPQRWWGEDLKLPGWKGGRLQWGSGQQV